MAERSDQLDARAWGLVEHALFTSAWGDGLWHRR